MSSTHRGEVAEAVVGCRGGRRAGRANRRLRRAARRPARRTGSRRSVAASYRATCSRVASRCATRFRVPRAGSTTSRRRGRPMFTPESARIRESKSHVRRSAHVSGDGRGGFHWLASRRSGSCGSATACGWPTTCRPASAPTWRTSATESSSSSGTLSDPKCLCVASSMV